MLTCVHISTPDLKSNLSIAACALWIESLFDFAIPFSSVAVLFAAGSSAVLELVLFDLLVLILDQLLWLPIAL